MLQPCYTCLCLMEKGGETPLGFGLTCFTGVSISGQFTTRVPETGLRFLPQEPGDGRSPHILQIR